MKKIINRRNGIFVILVASAMMATYSEAQNPFMSEAQNPQNSITTSPPSHAAKLVCWPSTHACYEQTPSGIICSCRYFPCKLWGLKDGCPINVNTSETLLKSK
jgi:hypothetical protein